MRREISFFSDRITNKTPNGETTLGNIKELIKSEKFKLATELVRKDKSKKNLILCYITPSGVFSYCKDSGLLVYSGHVNVDIDDTLKNYGLHPETVKHLLAVDTFLNFNMINISVSGNGVKGILTVKGGIAEEHLQYYSVIEKYIFNKYGIKIDGACRNISRAYYLSYDPDVYYNASGFVEREALLEMVPAPEPALSPRPGSSRYISSPTALPVFGSSTYSNREELPSSLLNRLPAVFDRACADLRSVGLKKIGGTDYWTRDGKEHGVSGIFNFYEKEQMYIFTCFSSNSAFFGRRGYAPVQIINIIEFNSDWNRCIAELSNQYLR